MKKKTERQHRDINPVSAVTGAANESVYTIEDTDILRSKTSINNNGGFFCRREYSRQLITPIPILITIVPR